MIPHRYYTPPPPAPPPPPDRSLQTFNLITRIALVLLAVGFLWFVKAFLWPESRVRHAPGILVANEPEQSDVKPPKVWDVNGYHITALATYSIEAEVLSKARYYMGRECDLSPVDFALGWGRMSDQSLLDNLQISQSGRWYNYHWDGAPPADPQEIVQHSANTHLLPATPAISAQLLAIKPGSIVKMKGYLISATASDGWTWVSSLSRYDTGNRSCEVMWVESVSARDQ